MVGKGVSKKQPKFQGSLHYSLNAQSCSQDSDTPKLYRGFMELAKNDVEGSNETEDKLGFRTGSAVVSIC